MKLLIFVLSFLSTLGSPSAAWAQVGSADSLTLSPFVDYRTLESEHFRVTFEAELRPMAQLVMNYMEEADARLRPFLRWSPRTKTDVLLTDNRDDINGSASGVARLGISLYLVPPDDTMSLAFYDDWLRILTF